MPLPWTEVNAWDSQDVARRIGLPKREKSERRKWSCPFCQSSDALHAYAGPRAGFGCWAACGAAQPKLCRGYSNVDVASQHWGVRPHEGCSRLAAELGIVFDDDGAPFRARDAAPVRAIRPREHTTAQELNLAALRRLPGARLPPVVYADVLGRLSLTARGARYLEGRSLDAEEARTIGFRSIDGAGGWRGIAAHLLAAYRREELAAAGFPLAEGPGEPRITFPFNGRFPALVIPFLRAEEVVGLRCRNLLPDNPEYKHNRYRTLTGAKPLWPYNADALRARIVHVCEGELNAETLRQLGASACGTYGAGIWLDRWTGEMAAAQMIVDWHDCGDPKGAGDLGAQSLRARLAAAYGEAWVARRWRRMITAADPNALHQANLLLGILRSRPWLLSEGAEVKALLG